ncbi:uncharacterized protein LOC124300295 isoform X1 [Neodiprion virginianus]|uniref:uncharacterized protein LOC124300295 isoform X1 n=2 Tax=Neodiprion virginianus TaxID=2961670 RepID=UPI001EE6B756|nr:uncharacterized protein LOC124300295 isoform X1 [Neodiprion virginianus]XP_046610206.1 uncharacterized protein LOC124300295 isoform X1 [Neodiprion virginianus]XP_046610213.1 uncharacterized protein LOC124300295 isoform X1 [Neodiprion virginianus]
MSQEHKWRPWMPAGAEEAAGGEGSMEIYIETLMGLAFEMTVSPNDTIGFIKQKIQRVEGIPVSQQNIVYNLCELSDSSTLLDHNIREGATLKLVLSMRGGPISTRRLPQVDDYSIRELREFVENNKENMMDQLPPGCRVTVLVFREGDSVSLFKVIENDDGTYSPIADSWSGSSIRNIFSDSDCEEVAERLQENSTTMEKMHALRQQMEKLSIQKSKKSKKKDEDEKTSGVDSLVSSNVVCREDENFRNTTLLPPIAAPKLPDPNTASFNLSSMPKKYLNRRPRELKSLPPEYYNALRMPSNKEYDDIVTHKFVPNKLDPMNQELQLNQRGFGSIGSEMASQTKNFGHIGSEMMARKKREQELANSKSKPFSTDPCNNMYLNANFERYDPTNWQRNENTDKDITLPDLRKKSFDNFSDPNVYRSHRHSPTLSNHENMPMECSSSSIAIVEEENPLDTNFSQSPITVTSTESTTVAISQLPSERLSKSKSTSKGRFRLRRYGLVFTDHERPKTCPDLKICQKSYTDLMSEKTYSYEESDTDSKCEYDEVFPKQKSCDVSQENIAGKHIIENPKFENGFADHSICMENVNDLLAQRMSDTSAYDYESEKDFTNFNASDKTRLFHQSLYNRITTGRNYITHKLGESSFEGGDNSFPKYDNTEGRLHHSGNDSNVHFLGRVKSPVLNAKDIFESSYENKESLFGLGNDGARITDASGYDSSESSYLQLDTAELQTVSGAEPQLQVLGRVRSPILSTKDIFHVDNQESTGFKPSSSSRLEELGIEQKIKILGRVKSPVLATDNYNFEKEHALYNPTPSDAAFFEKQIKILGRVTSPILSSEEYSYDKEDILYRPNFPVNDTRLDKHIQILGKVQKSAPKDKKNVQPIISNPPKKTTVKTRCFHCHKRLNITNIYNCRCGNLFCSAHRYSEVHGCNYDYKTAGRKFLEQNNPLVTAPKLPKI